MEFESFGLVGVFIIRGLGLFLTMYWTARIAQWADAVWPGRTNRVVFVTLGGRLALLMGGWLVAPYCAPDPASKRALGASTRAEGVDGPPEPIDTYTS